MKSEHIAAVIIVAMVLAVVLFISQQHEEFGASLALGPLGFSFFGKNSTVFLSNDPKGPGAHLEPERLQGVFDLGCKLGRHCGCCCSDNDCL